MKQKRTGRLRSQFKEALSEAFNTIRANKMRSGLVILGVLIGVASLMGMVAIVSGLNHFVVSSIGGGDTPILSLTKINVLKGEGQEEFIKRKNFKVEDAFAIRGLPHVEGVQIQYQANSIQIKYKDRKANFVAVIGSNQELLQIQVMSLAEGRYFTLEEQNHRSKTIVLGDAVKNSLFPDEDPIGKAVRVQGKEYTVVGAFESRKTFMGSLAENYAAIPYTAFERDFLNKFTNPDMNIIVDDKENIEEVEANVRAVMRMRRKVPLNQPDDFALITMNAVVDFTESITDNVALVLVVLASIALMIGGIGVMVIMLVSVTERTHEIGIRKAIGARRSQITMQFLIEAATLSGIGGLIGLGVGLGIGFAASLALNFPFHMPVGWTIFSIVMSAGVGLVFGVFPARKAARLDPIEALRYE